MADTELQVTGKQTKASVGYGPARDTSRERCGNCTYFEREALRSYGECYQVQGHINRNDLCRLWRSGARV